MEYMVPPITLCTNGHNICSKCREVVDCCPTCRAKFSNIRNVALETIARRQKYPCANRENGCPDLLSIEHIAEHQAVCTHGPIKCPFTKIGHKCSWNGVISDLEEHATAAHAQGILKSATFTVRVRQSQSGVLLFYCFDEVFVYYKKFRDGRYYCAIQLIGPSSQASKFKCVFKLRAANNIEEISKTFFVRSYSEDVETSFNSGKCLRLDDVTVRNFVVQDKLNLTVTLSRVQ
jgi:E3 ubiquitin-protein ligase SIAH1